MRALRPIVILVLAAAVMACGGGTSTPVADGGATLAPDPATETPVTAAPTASPEPATDAPSPEPSAETTEPSAETPSPEATAAPATPTAPGGAGGAGGAAACTGSDANRSFFAAASAAVDWPVLCAVLPKGWFVAEGSYRKAGGGKLLISYKGPGGASLALSEGSFCASDDGCVPSGSDLGDAALGPYDGTLVGLDDGGFAIVVDRGLSPSWLMVTRGLDQATTQALGAALAEVEGP